MIEMADQNVLSSDIILLRVICPGLKVPMRNKPHPSGEVLQFLVDGDEIQVYSKTKSGFYFLTNETGYVNKVTKNATFEEILPPQEEADRENEYFEGDLQDQQWQQDQQEQEFQEQQQAEQQWQEQQQEQDFQASPYEAQEYQQQQQQGESYSVPVEDFKSSSPSSNSESRNSYCTDSESRLSLDNLNESIPSPPPKQQYQPYVDFCYELPQPSKSPTKPTSSAPKCCACNKSVYAAEKVSAVNRIWHKTCFTCGGTGSDGGCKKVLTLNAYLDHGEDPFCKACHSRNFGPTGFHGGMATSIVNTSSASGSASSGKLSARQPKTDEANNSPETPKFVVSGTPKCALCNKSVYAAEKVNAINRIWHKTCFTCGGTGGEGCRKVLPLHAYVNHGADPFCKSCHARNFGPKGFHAGMSGTPINSYPESAVN